MLRNLAIEARLGPRWSSLSAEVQRYLAAFLGGQPVTDRVDVVAAGDGLPSLFLTHLAAGAPGFRAAFPALARRVTAIDGTGTVTIRIACDGTNTGPFFGISRPPAGRSGSRPPTSWSCVTIGWSPIG